MNAERAIFVSIFSVGLVSAAIALPVAGLSAAKSIAFGAGIALLNLWTLRSIVRVLIAVAEAPDAKPGGLGFFLGPKLVALLLLVWILLSRHIVSAAPFAIGFAALPIGVAIGAIVCEKPAR